MKFRLLRCLVILFGLKSWRGTFHEEEDQSSYQHVAISEIATEQQPMRYPNLHVSVRCPLSDRHDLRLAEAEGAVEVEKLISDGLRRRDIATIDGEKIKTLALEEPITSFASSADTPLSSRAGSLIAVRQSVASERLMRRQHSAFSRFVKCQAVKPHLGPSCVVDKARILASSPYS